MDFEKRANPHSVKLPGTSSMFKISFGLFGVFFVAIAVAADKRAPAPTFGNEQLRGVFFEKLSDGIRGTRPSLSSLRASAGAVAGPSASPASSPTSSAEATGGEDQQGWSKLVSAMSLEDEVKRVKLRFDSVITTPGAFNGGGYQEARRDLSILATLFAVIGNYDGEVRWKDQAAAARDLLARSAFNCKAGSTQVYNEAKLRKNDLQDLVSGSGLANRDADPQNDWSSIVDRSPLMEYLEGLTGVLQDASNNASAIESNSDVIRRQAELIAMLGNVLVQEGMDDSDDEDYQRLSLAMTSAGRDVASAIERGEFAKVREAVGAITQSCDACHEQFR